MVSLDGVVEALDRADIRAGKKADVEVSDRVNTEGSNKVCVIMGPHSKDEVVSRVESKVDTEDSYKLDLFIFKENHIENLFSYNLANVLANLFGNLSLTSINFRSSPIFLVFSSHLAAFDNTSGCKFLDFTFLGGPVTCNPGNILAFYY